MNDSDRIVFSATLPLRMRQEVEALFFFNPRQSFLSNGIHAAVAAAGLPAIAGNQDSVWIEIPPGRTQCLFASDSLIEPVPVIGVALYSRPALDTIWISHLAIDPAYAHGGENGKLEIAARLVDRVVTIAASSKGITRVQLPYRDARYIRVRRIRAGASDQVDV